MLNKTLRSDIHFNNLVCPPDVGAEIYVSESCFSMFHSWFCVSWVCRSIFHSAAHIRKCRFHAEVHKCMPVTHRRISCGGVDLTVMSVLPWRQPGQRRGLDWKRGEVARERKEGEKTCHLRFQGPFLQRHVPNDHEGGWGAPSWAGSKLDQKRGPTVTRLRFRTRTYI